MQFPPVSGASQIVEKIEQKNSKQNEIAPKQSETAPIDAHEWLIEPEAEELARISLWDSVNIGQFLPDTNKFQS